jgi:LysR family glycine cleavage system transcriptional activator
MTNKHPSHTALRCLDAAARHLSFTKAAGELNLTQGAVSRQILGLEDLVNVTVFLRKHAGLELTTAGRAYWIETSAALRRIDRATQNLAFQNGSGGVLNICAASSFATYWLIPRLPGFVKLHPEITLNLSTHIGPINLVDAVHDAAIEYCAGPQTELVAQHVLPLELGVYAAPGLLGGSVLSGGHTEMDRVAIGSLLQTQPLICHSTVPAAWKCWLQAAGLTMYVNDRRLAASPRYDLLSMALNAAISSLGLALLPGFLADGAVLQGHLVKLSSVTWVADKAYYLRYPESKSELVPLTCFRNWLKSE